MTDARRGSEVIFELCLSFFNIKVPILCQQSSTIRCRSISKSDFLYETTTDIQIFQSEERLLAPTHSKSPSISCSASDPPDSVSSPLALVLCESEYGSWKRFTEISEFILENNNTFTHFVLRRACVMGKKSTWYR